MSTLTEETHRSESDIIHQTLTGYLAANRGEFASKVLSSRSDSRKILYA
ncbi:hypothetical protein OYT1_ch2114 [Ferriphaselus amnicola]|uniref:Uncharacterized protein n=1 Tax=Ferriphaselus amnicola TaxID=1188319 RepID=A0A2Z6GEB4_9PROT|nr:hypothetical protein [Ferriphaselus amnicola]BBE51639.1 hypothetical protein OYT1_ch2114 [Ferriphaselus amnicola]